MKRDVSIKFRLLINRGAKAFKQKSDKMLQEDKQNL